MPVGSDATNSVGLTLATVSLETVYFPVQFEEVQAAIAEHAVPLGFMQDQLILVTELKPLPVRLMVGAYGVVALE